MLRDSSPVMDESRPTSAARGGYRVGCECPMSWRFGSETIYSDAPSGMPVQEPAAAVTVALVGASGLPYPRTALATHEMAYYGTCGRDTKCWHMQSGIQDQLCCAHSAGVNFIEMHDYPARHGEQYPVLPNPLWWELERRLALVFLGKSHFSAPRSTSRLSARLRTRGRIARSLEALREYRMRPAAMRCTGGISMALGAVR